MPAEWAPHRATWLSWPHNLETWPTYLEKVRETLLRNFEKGLKEDGFWLGNLQFYRENELAFADILKLPERAKALTANQVREAARKYFASDNMLNARLLPEVVRSADGKAKE